MKQTQYIDKSDDQSAIIPADFSLDGDGFAFAFLREISGPCDSFVMKVIRTLLQYPAITQQTKRHLSHLRKLAAADAGIKPLWNLATKFNSAANRDWAPNTVDNITQRAGKTRMPVSTVPP